MIAQLGESLSRVFRKTAPDPFVIAILLTIITAVLAITLGEIHAPEQEAPAVGLVDKSLALLAAWRADDGLWKFLAFGMQMCLILVTGHALARTKLIAAAIDALARIPQGTASAAALVSFVACLSGLINWGLGLIVGALLAREVGASLSKRGINGHYPLICAAGYMGLLVWHGGMSGSAPLTMTTAEGARKVLPDGFLAGVGEAGISLEQTIFSPMNLVVSGGMLIGIPILLALMRPPRESSIEPIERFTHVASAREEQPSPVADDEEPGVPDRLDNSPVLAWLLALPLILALAQYGQTQGFSRLGLNEINAGMLALGLILHGSPRSYMQAVTEGARGCAGIIIQFPLYAGIMAMMAAAGLVTMLAETFTSVGGQRTIPILSFASAAIVNLFVPSGGGQWGIQGPIALETGIAADIPVGKMIMAVAYGDQLTNMLQPFWALPLLGITGVRARDIVGYTAVVMLAAALWMILGLLIF